MNKILVVDDDNDLCLLLNRFLTRNGYLVANANSGGAAADWLKKNKPELVLCDYKLDDMTGVELLQKTKEMHPGAPVIIITGYSDVKDAVEVMKQGAFDYVTKPLYPDEILLTIKKALAQTQPVMPEQPVGNNTKSGNTEQPNTRFVSGDSRVFAGIMQQIELVAPTNYSVIIYGESGSGKEGVAHQIHSKSKRADKPFVAIDCGALSRDLAGSELFGHEKGAFTGAISQKIGSFEIANQGTIFLDEVANLTYEVQISLLRVVQERKIKRVGGIKDIDIDVRIIIASNEKLWDSARSGKFREDLYHRFNEFSIELPALRDRKEDIMLFAHHFLSLTNAELGKNVKGFSTEVENILNNYVWYGNLRELKNVVKRATLLTDGNMIEAKSLPFEISNFYKLQFDTPLNLGPTPNEKTTSNTTEPASFEKKLKGANIDAEYGVILDALKQANYNKSKAAKLLNVDRKTLYNKMKLYKEFNMD